MGALALSALILSALTRCAMPGAQCPVRNARCALTRCAMPGAH